MKITVKSKLPPNSTAQDVFNLLLQNRLGTLNFELLTLNYLSPPHPTSLSLIDFGFEKDYIDQAMDLIWRCHPDHPDNKNPHKPIVVYTDYDADGITGGAILWETLHTLGFKAFPYTPNRITEGYGFSTQGLDMVKEKYDPALIISVDHGIVADTQVTYALEKLNVPIIVTDHHHRQEEKIPKHAKAIFHIPALSGSGTAYYVAKEIWINSKFETLNSKPKEIRTERNTVIARSGATKQSHNAELGTQDLGRMFETDYVGIAAIGTIADLVPLQGPSRSIAYHGLINLTETQRPGLVALKKVADHIGKTVTTYEVGFLLAPRINASGRLEDALDALRLLCTKDAERARVLAEKLNSLNIQRQDMVKVAVEEALKIVDAQKDTDGNLPKILIVHQRQVQSTLRLRSGQAPYKASNGLGTRDSGLGTFVPWHEGIIGLIASKICEKYHRPTIVLTPTENEDPNISKLKIGNWKLYKASCRSISGFHMTDYLTAMKNVLVKFGGHEMAAGFSINADKLDKFTKQSQKYADTYITDEMLERTITVDCELPLNLASIEFAEMLEQMAPFGMGNPKPVFMSSGKIINAQAMGKEQKHARFRLVQGTEGLDFVAFGKAEEILAKSEENSDFSVIYTLDINRWNGSEKVQGKFVASIKYS